MEGPYSSMKSALFLFFWLFFRIQLVTDSPWRNLLAPWGRYYPCFLYPSLWRFSMEEPFSSMESWPLFGDPSWRNLIAPWSLCYSFFLFSVFCFSYPTIHRLSMEEHFGSMGSLLSLFLCVCSLAWLIDYLVQGLNRGSVACLFDT